MQKGMWS